MSKSTKKTCTGARPTKKKKKKMFKKKKQAEVELTQREANRGFVCTKRGIVEDPCAVNTRPKEASELRIQVMEKQEPYIAMENRIYQKAGGKSGPRAKIAPYWFLQTTKGIHIKIWQNIRKGCSQGRKKSGGKCAAGLEQAAWGKKRGKEIAKKKQKKRIHSLYRRKKATLWGWAAFGRMRGREVGPNIASSGG